MCTFCYAIIGVSDYRRNLDVIFQVSILRDNCLNCPVKPGLHCDVSISISININ